MDSNCILNLWNKSVACPVPSDTCTWPLGRPWWREHAANGHGEWVRPTLAHRTVFIWESCLALAFSVPSGSRAPASLCFPLLPHLMFFRLTGHPLSLVLTWRWPRSRDLSSTRCITPPLPLSGGRTVGTSSKACHPRGPFESLCDCWWSGSIVQMSLKVSH